MEEPNEYQSTSRHPRPARTIDDPDFIGAEAALKRASAKAVARDLAAGLEPIIRSQAHPQRASLGNHFEI